MIGRSIQPFGSPVKRAYTAPMIILGLGNPGTKYAKNRHNVGFMVLDAYAAQESLSFAEEKLFFSEVARTGDMVLAKPHTFMNDSGKAAKVLLKQYGDELVVVYDEINVPIGEVKCSYDRGSGDHNGVQSIIDHLGHQKFFRIRVGVRPVHEELLPRIAPPDGFEKFMLSDFTPMEQDLMKQGIEKAVKIIHELQNKSFEQIMNEYN
jgi:peptidyl-tRNA hydrolase, PTH1 family